MNCLTQPQYRIVLLTALVLPLAGCDDFDPAPVNFTQDDIVAIGDLHTLELRGHILSSLPEQSPPNDTEKVVLGRNLFWDPILSGDRDVACATCHLPEHAYTDDQARAIGVGGVGRGASRLVGHTGFVKRNTPTVLNTAWNGIDELGVFDPPTAPMFWDNRTEGLPAQALEPIASREEMRGDTIMPDDISAEIEKRLSEIPEYRAAFVAAYGDDAPTIELVADALAAFQTTLVANNAPFDRWMRGEPDAMSAAQISGMQEFVIAGCADCHSGPLFSDFEPHVLGIEDPADLDEPDVGSESFAFRTPTLRQLKFTAPYFHAGQFETLGSVIDFYDEPRRSRNPNVRSGDLDPKLLRVPEMEDGRGATITTFLGALNDPGFDQSEPDSVPSGLHVGGRLQ